MSKKMRNLLTICAVVGLIVAVNGTAEANWFEDFNDMTFDATWTIGCYPDYTGTFSHDIQDGPGDDDYLLLKETTHMDFGGSQIGMGIGEPSDIFTDVRVGAVVNVDANSSYIHGLAARTTWFIDDGTATGHPGFVAVQTYVMFINWQDGPANLKIELLKIAYNLDAHTSYPFEVSVPDPGTGHDRSYYAELDVVGAGPVYVTGSLYESKDGPLVYRTPTMIDTAGVDAWEDGTYTGGMYYTSGASSVFGTNQVSGNPAGYHATFDSVSSISDGPAAVCLSPPDGATDVPIDANLIWVEADFATSRELWFGREGAMEKVMPAPDSNTYDPGTLDYGQTYQWRVDEVNDTSGTTVEGHVWTFTTLDSLLVDDMESYTDRISIATIWRDGYTCVDWGDPPDKPPITGGCSGSVVDVDSGVGGGTKAMVFNYDNDGNTFVPGNEYWEYDAPYYSEAWASTSGPNSLDVGQDWTSTKAMSLWFYGQSGNDATEQMYVVLDDGTESDGVVYYDGDMNDIKIEDWQEWNIALQDFNDQGVNLADVNNIYIGFGDRDNPQEGGSGVVYFDDIRLYPTRCLLSLRSPDFARVDYVQDCVIDYKEVAVMAEAWLVEAAPPGDANLVAWYEFEGDANDSSGNGHHGVANGSPSYTGGKFGQAINLDGLDDYVETSKTASQLSIGGGAARTTTAWVYTRAFNGGGIWDLGSHADGENWSLRTLDTDNVWRAQLHGGDFDFDITYPSKEVWIHFALVYDGTAAGNEYRLYADGDLIGSKTRALNTTEGTTFQIGRWGGEFFDGLVDDVRIYNVVLTDVEILGLALRTDLYEDQKINFKDFAVLADMWLDEQLVP